jgi:hypothetical protein
MASLTLSLGLLAGGGLGFLLGAKPEVVLCLHPEAKREARDRAQAAVDLLYPLAAAFFAGFVFSTLVPEALSHSRGTLTAFALGLAGMALLSRKVLKRDPCCEAGHDHGGIGIASLAAMAVCSVNDGLLLGLLQPPFASGLNLGMLLHKVSSSFAIAQVLMRSGIRGPALAACGAAYVAVSPAAFHAAAWPQAVDWPGSSLATGFSAGILAYIALASLAPHAGGILRRRPRALAGFSAALALALGLGFWHRALHREGSHGGSGTGTLGVHRSHAHGDRSGPVHEIHGIGVQGAAPLRGIAASPGGTGP